MDPSARARNRSPHSRHCQISYRSTLTSGRRTILPRPGRGLSRTNAGKCPHGWPAGQPGCRNDTKSERWRSQLVCLLARLRTVVVVSMIKRWTLARNRGAVTAHRQPRAVSSDPNGLQGGHVPRPPDLSHAGGCSGWPERCAELPRNRPEDARVRLHARLEHGTKLISLSTSAIQIDRLTEGTAAGPFSHPRRIYPSLAAITPA